MGFMWGERPSTSMACTRPPRFSPAFATATTAPVIFLIRRFLPRLRRWAHGRIPSYVHNLNDTDDLVQVTFLKALDRMKTFEPRQRGSFLAYLRRILLNEITSLVRGAGEMGCTHEEVAAELGLPSADAARMLVTRALVRLSEVMRER